MSHFYFQIGAMKSSMLYFAQATKATDALTKDNNDQRYSDVCKQVELTRGLMLFGKNEVNRTVHAYLHEIKSQHKYP